MTAKFYGFERSFLHDTTEDDAWVIDMVRASEYVKLESDVSALQEQISRYSMSPGWADQRQNESKYVRVALGFGADAEDVAPCDLVDAITALKEQVRALAAENSALINSSVCTLQEGRPPYGFYASEWFIAKLKNGQYAALKALPEEYSHDYRTNDGTYFTKDWVVGWMQTPDTEYRPNVTTTATDASLREIRAQSRAEGIHFAANRILAAWESGFIDDTAAAAYDISGAVLSAVEFLPNADEGEFKREYADEVRARIRAGRS